MVGSDLDAISEERDAGFGKEAQAEGRTAVGTDETRWECLLSSEGNVMIRRLPDRGGVGDLRVRQWWPHLGRCESFCRGWSGHWLVGREEKCVSLSV